MEKLLISACLLGKNTKYNGKNNYIEQVKLLDGLVEYVLICPEVMGGLSTPRDPSEIKNQKVFSNKMKDVTKNFYKGAEDSLKIALKDNIKVALLKEKSPSCGVHKIYDGTFSNTIVDGLGVTTKLLKENGIKVFNEFEIEELIKYLKDKSL